MIVTLATAVGMRAPTYETSLLEGDVQQGRMPVSHLASGDCHRWRLACWRQHRWNLHCLVQTLRVPRPLPPV